jgi:hypothetical protein
MVKIKAIVWTLVLWAAAQYGLAQSQLLEYPEKEFNFGTIVEDQPDRAQHSFSLTNIAKHPIKIIDVQTGCGCIISSYTQDAIPSRQSGMVLATFDPRGRPGPFSKGISVRVAKFDPKKNVVDSTVFQVVVFGLMGEVKPRDKNIKDLYPFSEGNIRMNNNHVAFGTIYSNQTLTKTVTFYNQGTKPIAIKGTDNRVGRAQYLKIDGFNPEKPIAPKDSTKITITYDARLTKEMDISMDQVFLLTTDDSVARKTLHVSARVMPFISEEIQKNPPIITFDTLSIDLGDVPANKGKEGIFKFTNTGKGALQIFNIKASCGCMTPKKLDKEAYATGEGDKIIVGFNPAGKSGEQLKQITVTTNDPKRMVVKLNVRANVVPASGN